jgi:hypothetical protein
MVFTTVAVMLPPVTAHAAPTLTEIYKGVTFSQESVKNDTDANADANVNTHVIKVDIKGGHVKFRIGIPNDATAPVPGDLQRTTCLNKNGKPE